MGKYFIVIVVVLIVIAFFYQKSNTFKNKQPVNEIRYVTLGDSYTIGEGASVQESWPTLLTNHLQQKGIQILLIANPSVTGWTTQQVIDNELPIYDSSHPTFATLLIGVNDWVQGVDSNTFHRNLITILDHMQAKLPDKQKLILITIPDFSVTPVGMQYSNGRDIANGIHAFNSIITQEGTKRGLAVVDIYPLTQGMKDHPDLIASDGLHPSAKEYALWERLIFPTAFSTIQPNEK